VEQKQELKVHKERVQGKLWQCYFFLEFRSAWPEQWKRLLGKNDG